MSFPPNMETVGTNTSAKLDINASVLKQVTELDSTQPFTNFDEALDAIKWGYVTEIKTRGSKFQSSDRMRAVIWGIASDFFAPPHRFFEHYKAKLLECYLGNTEDNARPGC